MTICLLSVVLGHEDKGERIEGEAEAAVLTLARKSFVTFLLFMISFALIAISLAWPRARDRG